MELGDRKYVDRFIQIREEKGQSVEDVCQILDMDPQLLRMVELGEMLPTQEQLEKIMQYVIDEV